MPPPKIRTRCAWPASCFQVRAAPPAPLRPPRTAGPSPYFPWRLRCAHPLPRPRLSPPALPRGAARATTTRLAGQLTARFEEGGVARFCDLRLSGPLPAGCRLSFALADAAGVAPVTTEALEPALTVTQLLELKVEPQPAGAAPRAAAAPAPRLRTLRRSSEIGGHPDRMVSPRSTARSGSASTFDADAFTASLADELGINAASISVLSTEVVDNGLDNGINVVASGAPRQLRTPVASTEIGGPPDRMLSPRSTARSGSASAAAAALAAAGAAAWAVAAAAGAP